MTAWMDWKADMPWHLPVLRTEGPVQARPQVRRRAWVRSAFAANNSCASAHRARIKVSFLACVNRLRSGKWAMDSLTHIMTGNAGKISICGADRTKKLSRGWVESLPGSCFYQAPDAFCRPCYLNKNEGCP